MKPLHKRRIRTKKRWTLYFRENFFKLNPYTLMTFQNKKSKFLADRMVRQFRRTRRQFGFLSMRLKRTTFYTKTLLKSRQKFKLYFRYKTERKFKKFLRFSLKFKKKSLAFHCLLQRRLDYVLTFANFFRNLNITNVFIKNGFVKVNGHITKDPNYFVKNIDVIQVDYRISKIVYRNIIRSLRKKKLFSKNVFINFKTLELQTVGHFTEKTLKVTSNMALNLVKRAYRR